MAGLNASGLLTTVSGQSWPGVDYFCTTRQGGASSGPWSAFNLGLHTGDDAENVATNRQLLRASLPDEPVWLRQVHGVDVHDADISSALSADGAPPVADAAITTRPARVLAIMTADCLPVVISSTDGKALGVAHAGWRGLAAGVLENTLDALRARATQAPGWRAWVGPAISQSCFEVGEDVYDAFVGRDAQTAVFFFARPDVRNRKWMADLPGLARWRLHRAGVGDVALSGQCTYSRADLFYSYRRDGETGRLATLAWLSGQASPRLHGAPDLP